MDHHPIERDPADDAPVTGFDSTTRSWTAVTASAPEPPPLDGELRTVPPDLEAASDDFGHLVRRRPLAVLRPGSVSDVAAMLRYCRARAIPVAARGQGHSTWGQAQVADGLVLDMGGLCDVRIVGDTAVVGAGARWSEVLRAALPHGLAPPVLTDYLELSVGGTLSVGGVGGATHRHGAQVDGVLELEVVTGAGERAVCSPTLRPDLFGAVLAGLGQCAVIVRATLRLVPARPSVRCYQLRYPTVAALTADQRRLVREDRFDHVEGQAQPEPDGAGGWRYLLEAAVFFDGGTAPDDGALIGDLGHERGTEVVEDLSHLDFADRMAPGVAYLESTGEWYDPHPWLNVFLPDSATDSFVSSTMAALTPADIGPSGVVLLYPVRREPLRTPLLRVPEEPLVFLFALLKTATPAPGVPGPEEMVRANRALYEGVRAVGGFQYPVGSIPMSPADWRAHFGTSWADLAVARDEYDPGAVLTPGPGIF